MDPTLACCIARLIQRKSYFLCVTNAETSPQNYAEDGGRSSGVDLQGWASNRRMLLRSKGVVVSNTGKVVLQGWQVGIEKVSASEPLITHRKDPDAVKTGGGKIPQDQPESDLFIAQVAAGVQAARVRYRLLHGT